MLENVKGNLRETLLEGIAETISALKAILPKNTSKAHSLILIESQLKDVKKQQMHGLVSDEDAQRMRNQIRSSLMELINDLSPQDLAPSKPAAGSATTPPLAGSPPPKNSRWTAALVEENGLDLLSFKIQLDEPDAFDLVLSMPNSSTTRLTVNGEVVEETTLNLVNAVSGILNLLTFNTETLRFQLNGSNRVYTGTLSYGVNLSKSTYKRIELRIDGVRVFYAA